MVTVHPLSAWVGIVVGMCEKGMEAGGGSTWQEITLITGYISVGEFEPMGCVSKRLKLV
jgi:hypothetical protein